MPDDYKFKKIGNLDAERSRINELFNLLKNRIAAVETSINSGTVLSSDNADLLDGQHGNYYLMRSNHLGTQPWNTITATPTTLTGYGITDAQPLDAQLTSIAGLNYTGNASKVVAVKADESGFELVASGGGSGQAAIQFKDEGSNVGGSGAITVFDVVGAGAALTNSGTNNTLTVPGMIGVTRSAKTAAYTVVTADRGSTIDCTSGTFTVSLTAAATLGDGFHVAICNSGSGTITIDPDGSETIRTPSGSGTTATLAQGEGLVLCCDGSGWLTVVDAKASSGGGGGDFVKIGKVVTTGSASTITFSSIPGTYTDLRLVITGRDTNTGTTSSGAFFRLNSDSTSGNYTSSTFTGYIGAVGADSGENSATSNGVNMGIIPGSSGNADAVGTIDLLIPNYSATTFQKILTSTFTAYSAFSGTPRNYVYRMGAVWKSTAAITDIVLTAGGTAFVDGTTATLYGLG